jgi:GTP pyrophosphokinase
MPAFSNSPRLTKRFDDALAYASYLHRNQVRKGTDIPYVSHLLAVTDIVLEAGADEDTAIAALLHDAVEDQGGAVTLSDIRSMFGDRVAGIVEACSETDEDPKPPWPERKERYVRHVRAECDPAVLLVVAADKLHNASAQLRDYREQGAAFWSRFNAGLDRQLWFYDEVVAGLMSNPAAPHELVKQLAAVVDGIRAFDPEVDPS